MISKSRVMAPGQFLSMIVSVLYAIGLNIVMYVCFKNTVFF